jgi:hypothetical protein
VEVFPLIFHEAKAESMTEMFPPGKALARHTKAERKRFASHDDAQIIKNCSAQ